MGSIQDGSAAERDPFCINSSAEMEAQNPQQSRVIEFNADIPGGVESAGGSKTCGDAPCGFADAGSTSKDAKERSRAMQKLLLAVILCAIFMAIEVVGGIKANSLAILTDAAHLLSDVASFAISLFSLWAAGWEATPRQSFGFFRIEILGALVSIQLIWLLAGILVYETIVRLINDTGEVNGFLMFAVSAFGLVVNIIMALLLGHDHGHSHSHGHGHGHDHGQGQGHGNGVTVSHRRHHHHHHRHDVEQGNNEQYDSHENHKHDDSHNQNQALLDGYKGEQKDKRRNINVQGAYLHVLGDSIQSVGVMIGGAIIWFKPDWRIVDLICTLIFSVIVLATTINMLRNILEVLMESTPREIDATKLENGLLQMDEVVAVHELHIWAITVGKILLACHVKIRPEANADMVLERVINYIRREYNISHVTIQIER